MIDEVVRAPKNIRDRTHKERDGSRHARTKHARTYARTHQFAKNFSFYSYVGPTVLLIGTDIFQS